MEERLNEIEIALSNLERTVDEINTELFRQSKIIERLERENKALKETISIHAGVDCFDVVKTETLIGLEMSMNETNDMSIV